MAKKKKLWFSEGDNVVYPGYGVGTVHGFEELNLGGTVRSFCVLLVNEGGNESRVRIPLDNVDEVRLRKLSTKKEVQKAMQYLDDGDPEVPGTWRGRFAAHGELLSEGSLESVAHVLKALHVLDKKSPLSFREKKMYQKALQLFATEAGKTLDKPKEEVEETIIKVLEKTQ